MRRLNSTVKIRNSFFAIFIVVCLIPWLHQVQAANVKCAIVQYGVQHRDSVGIDDDRIENFVREAAAHGAEIIVVGEICFYRMGGWSENGVTMLDLANEHTNIKTRFSGLAEELNVCIVVGTGEPSGDPSKPVYNAAFFFGPDGNLLGMHRKMVPASGEVSFTRPGSEANGDATPFQTPYGRVGMLICKDMDSNYWPDIIAAKGMDLFIGVNGDPSRGWEKVVRGCQQADCYGIGVNLHEPQYANGHTEPCGNSGFVDTDGNVISEAGLGEKIIYESLPLPYAPDSFLFGQIVVDSIHPQWLVYNKDENNNGKLDPFFMCGPGDPEGFLYRGTLNPDGTRDGDQMLLIEKLIGTGANCIYLMAVRSHGGDGDPTENPFVNHDPGQGINTVVLDQWDTWFTAMDTTGIVIFFFFYDDDICLNHSLWDTGDTVGIAEQDFINTLVNRFEDNKHLIWVVKEEYAEGYSTERVSNIAAAIRAADDHNHIIAVHQNSGLVFDFPDDVNIDQFAVQCNVGTAGELHNGLITTWNNAAGRYNLNMSEAANHGTGTTARKKNWACALAGAYVMILGMDIANTSISDLDDCGRLVEFMESTDINEMAPHDELIYEGTEYVLAQPGNSYIAYASDLVGDIGLRNMTAGYYDFMWYNVTNGTTVFQSNIPVPSGDQTWSTPAEIGNELAVYIYEYVPGGVSEEHSVDVYPNPCRTYMGVDFITFTNLKSGDVIKVYDMSGRIIHDSGNLSEATYKWNVRSLSSGIYFYKIEVKDKPEGKIVIVR
ncbi:T9SS type A sorting domain-containing protein [candidate division WOR-3 bacterium]|nr:T9SS type A sorting domain-containing protein [candidate division WOR-3 bacterium]